MRTRRHHQWSARSSRPDCRSIDYRQTDRWIGSSLTKEKRLVGRCSTRLIVASTGEDYKGWKTRARSCVLP